MKSKRALLRAYGAKLERYLNQNLSGSGFDSDWKVTVNRPYDKYPIVIHGEYHCMNEAGYYDGWVYFKIVQSLPNISKRQFDKLLIWSYEGNRYKFSKYNLKDYIENVFQETLVTFESTEDEEKRFTEYANKSKLV